MVVAADYLYEDGYLNEYDSESRNILTLVGETYDQSLVEKRNFFVEGLADDFITEIFSEKLNMEMSDLLDKHSPKILPDDLLENFQIMQQASEQNPLKILDTTEEQLAYLEKMENIWNRTTPQHIQYMRDRDFEGNVDERTWYRLALQLKKAGVLKDLGE